MWIYLPASSNLISNYFYSSELKLIVIFPKVGKNTNVTSFALIFVLICSDFILVI